jgi:hypothetical protein
MLKLREVFDALGVTPHLYSERELRQALSMILRVQDLAEVEKDELESIFLSGPIFDGDVISPANRNALVEAGFVAKVVFRGEEGFNACTYLGAQAYRLIRAERKQITGNSNA